MANDVGHEEVFIFEERCRVQIPPLPMRQQLNELTIEAPSDDPRWIPDGDPVITHVFRHDSAGANDGTVADSDTRQDDRSVPDPDIMADIHWITARQML